MSIPKLLSAWRSDPTIANNVAEWRTIPARPAQTVPLPDDLHPVLVDALFAHNIHHLYTHQATTWSLIKEGKNVAVITATASGKTLCYNLPIIDRALHDPETCALYLFPTKALAQDQVSAIYDLSPSLQATSSGKNTWIQPSVYDGDTPASARSAIRENARCRQRKAFS